MAIKVPFAFIIISKHFLFIEIISKHYNMFLWENFI